MLPRESRLTDADGFRRATRSGRRCGSSTLVTHLLIETDEEVSVLSEERSAVTPVAPVRVGFVVSKAVGGAVVRNRVKRRLRHLVAARQQAHPGELAGASLLVVRATPAAGAASYDVLGRDLERCLTKLTSAWRPSSAAPAARAANPT